MMRSFWRNVPWLALFAAFTAGMILGVQMQPAWAEKGTQDRDALFAPFWEAWDLITTDYVEPVDQTALMESALSGMMNSLEDPYSFYMDPEVFAIVNTDLDGEFEGIGATVRQDEETGALVIIDTLPGSPAQAAGIQSGDAIVQVDGIDVTDMLQGEIISRIRGPENTAVELGIVREGEPEMLAVSVIRSRITIASVEGERLDNGMVYIRLTQFGADTAVELRSALNALNVEDSAGLIVDFRNNPGGYLNTAVDVASEFLADGLVLTERFREGEREYQVSGNPAAPTVPMVVLVDAGSASASELVAGALQDQGRAMIVGNPTFGKGSVQTWRELSNGGGVRVTIARWYTPEGRTIQGVGLIPDVLVDSDAGGEDPYLQAAVGMLLETVAAEQN